MHLRAPYCIVSVLAVRLRDTYSEPQYKSELHNADHIAHKRSHTYQRHAHVPMSSLFHIGQVLKGQLGKYTIIKAVQETVWFAKYVFLRHKN
jgi:hypothetical protein